MSFLVLQQLTDPFQLYLNTLPSWDNILSPWQLSLFPPQPISSLDLLTASLSPIPLWNPFFPTNIPSVLHSPPVSTPFPVEFEERASSFLSPLPFGIPSTYQATEVTGDSAEANANVEPPRHPDYETVQVGGDGGPNLSPLAFHNPGMTLAEELSNSIVSTARGDTWICNWVRNLHVIIKYDHQHIWILCPSGTVEKQPNKIHAYIENMGHRYVKFWQRGISFSSQNSGLPYLMDPAGVRLQWDNFKRGRLSSTQIWKKLVLAAELSPEQETRFYITELKTDDGEIKISFDDGVQASISKFGKIRVQAGDMYATASLRADGKLRHVFVRRESANIKERFHYDGRQLFVRSAGQEAYLDINGDLRL